MLRQSQKVLQRGCFSLLQTKLGALLVLLTAVLMMNTLLHTVDRHFGTSLVCEGGCQNNYRDNIGGFSSEKTVCTEPIDAVYTWVNGSEPQHEVEVAFWQALQRAEETHAPFPGVSNASNTTVNTTTEPPKLSEEAIEQQSSRSRFEDHDELRYSMRSLERYAPWVRHVYIVTNGQVPIWLDTRNPKVTIVPHSTIFPNSSDLPTFSSPAIEAHLHRIPGLSKRFLYLNDDTFFAAPVEPDDFYSPSKGHRIYMSWPVPNCADGCPPSWVSDGYCDKACNTTECEWDGGDCVGDKANSNSNNGLGAGAYSGSRYSQYGSASSPNPDWCASSCNDNWIGDKYCDGACNNAACGFDGTDCGVDVYRESTEMPMLNITSHAKHYAVPHDTVAIALNLTSVFPKGASRITSGDHDTPSWVRTATISQPNKVMVLTVMKDASTRFRSRCGFELEGKLVEGSQDVSLRFNITIEAPPPLSTARPHHTNHSEMDEMITQTLVEEDVATTPSPQDGPVDPIAVQKSLKGYRDRRHGRDPRAVQHRRREEVRRRRNTRRQLEQVEYDDEIIDVSAMVDPKERESKPVSINSQAKMLPNSNGMHQQKQASLRKLQELGEHVNAEAAAWDAVVKEHMPPSQTLEENDALVSTTRRRLFDMFGDSLKFGNKLMTQKYGSSTRKVPAHMVHMIDRDVVSELWRQWPEELARTSASKFRSKTNVQYAFMHFYHIIHNMKNRTTREIFDEVLDHNRNGYIDEIEVRRIGLMLWEKAVPESEVRELLLEAINPWLEPDVAPTTSEKESSILQPPPEPIRTQTLLPQEEEDEVDQEAAVEPTQAPTTSGRKLASIHDDDSIHLDSGDDAAATPAPHTAPEPQATTHYRHNRTNNTVVHSTSTPSSPPEPSPTPMSAFSFTNNPTEAPYEQINPMPDTYLDVVGRLVWFAVEGYQTGVGNFSGRRIKPAWTGRMTFAHFNESHLARLVAQHYSLTPAYRHTMEELDDVTFIMVRDNTTVVQHNMDHVLFKRPKFLCVNDNMNHSHPDHPEVVNILHSLFDGYYPDRSSFELPQYVRNDFTRIEGDTVSARLFHATQQPVEVLLGRGKRDMSITVLMWVLLIAAWIVATFCGGQIRHAWRRRRAEANDLIVDQVPAGQVPNPFYDPHA